MAKKIGKPLASFGVDRLRMLLHGEPGSGKTTKATSIAKECKTLYVYCVGSPGKESIPHEYRDNISVERISSYQDTAELFWSLQVEDHGFSAVIFEDLHSFQDILLRESKGYDKENRGKSGMMRTRDKASPNMDARRLYGGVVPLMADTMVYWYSLADGDRDDPMSVIFTAQTKYRRKDYEDEEEEPKWRPDVSPGSWNAVEANPDFIGYCAVEDDLESLQEEATVYTVRFLGTENILAKMHTPISRTKKITEKYPGAVFGRGGSDITVPKLSRLFGVKLK